MTGRQWLSAHVFRHDDHNRLLLDVLAPLAGSLRGQGLIRGFFYLRYWEGGPHLRVRLLPTAGAADPVRRQLTGTVGEFLRAHPSSHPVDPVAYRELARSVAAFEGHHGYDPELQPADSIRFLPYPPEYTSFGRGQSLRAVEAHFDASTRVALATLARPAKNRTAAALAMTLAVLLALDPGLLEHLRRPAPGHPLADFDRAEAAATFRRNRPQLAATAEQLRSGAVGGLLAAWLETVRELRARLTALSPGGGFVPEPVEGLPPAQDPVAHALLRCLHLHLNRLGVTVAQEARLRQLAALTLTEGARP